MKHNPLDPQLVSLIVANLGSNSNSGFPFIVGIDPDDGSIIQDYDSAYFGIHKIFKLLCFEKLNHFGIVAQLVSNGVLQNKTSIFIFSAKTSLNTSFSRFLDYYELPFLLKNDK